MKLVARALCFALVGLLSFSVSCTKKSNLENQVMNLGNGAEIKDLDPHIATGVPEFWIIQNLFEGLVQKDPKTLQPIQGVAQSWTISPDGKTYTFKLNPAAKYSNGDPVTAHDFVYSWTRLLKPETAAEYAFQAYYIKNGKAFNEGKLKDASQLGVKATDDHTLVVNLESPTPFFLQLLYHHSLYPVHRASVEKHGQKWTRPENIITNGAFKLEKWEMNKVISIVPNEHYWDRAVVKLKRANFFPVENQATEEKMFRSGELDKTLEVPIEKLGYWQQDKTGVFRSFANLGSYYYWYNVAKPPLDNKLVRQALALAIDRDRLVKFVTKGGQKPGTTLTPPGAGGTYFPTPRLPGDGSGIAKAKELLKKAGYPDGKGFPTVEILYNTQEGHKKIAEAIQEMWKQNLGIDVKLFNQEWKVYLDAMHSKNFQISRAGWNADYNDPNTFLDMFVSDSGVNYSNWKNPQYDALIKAASKEMNSKKRMDIFQKAEDLLLEELPIIPIYIYTRNYLLRNEVQGWYENIEDIHPLKWVSIERKS